MSFGGSTCDATKSGTLQEGIVVAPGSWAPHCPANQSRTMSIVTVRSEAAGRGSCTRFAPLAKLLVLAPCTPDAGPNADCTLRHPGMHVYPSAEKGPDPRMAAWGRRLIPLNLQRTTALRARKIETKQHRLAATGFSGQRLGKDSKLLTVHGFVHFSPVMNGCKRACCGDHRSIGFMFNRPWQKSMNAIRLFISTCACEPRQ